jgi:Transcriptional regulator, effector-binding domain/component
MTAIETINKTSEIALAIKYESIDFTNMAEIMSAGYQKLFAYIAECGGQVVGAPYCKYSNGSEDFMRFDIELGIPIASPISEKDEIHMAKTCEGKAIAAMHKGAYKEIEKTYAPMMQYLAENNLQSTGIYYDYYISDPSNTPESELLTQVVFPLK